MIKDPKQWEAIRKKGVLSPKIGKHGKRKSTLIREQIMREHAEKNLGVLTEIADIKINIARAKVKVNNPNPKTLEVKLKAIESIEDRVLGKVQNNNVNVNIELPRPIYGGKSREN